MEEKQRHIKEGARATSQCGVGAETDHSAGETDEGTRTHSNVEARCTTWVSLHINVESVGDSVGTGISGY